MRGSIRLHLFGTLVMLPVIVAAVISAIAIDLIHRDKELYVYDLSAQNVELMAGNLATKLESLGLKAKLEGQVPPFLALSRTEASDAGRSYVIENISTDAEARLRVVARHPGEPHLTMEIRPSSLIDLRGYVGPLEVMVINRQGQLLVHRDLARVKQREKLGQLVRKLGLFTRKGARVGTREVPHKGEATIVAFARVGPSLAVLQTMDKSLVGAAAKPLVTTAVVAASVVVLVAVLVALILGRTIVRPLRLMARQAEAIGRGEFGVAVEARTAKEIAQVMVSFNAMSSALKRRAEELSHVNRQLVQAERLNSTNRMITAIVKEISDPLERCFLLASQAHHRLPESSSLRGMQKEIMDEANRVSNILQNLARLTSREESPSDATEPDIVVSDILVSSKPLFENHQLKVTTELDQVGKVGISSDELRNALLDLFLYVTHTTHAEGSIHVSLKKRAQGASLEISFTSAPLSPEDSERLLQPTSKGGPHELSVVAMVLQEQGGQMKIRPTENGNQIIVLLPPS